MRWLVRNTCLKEVLLGQNQEGRHRTLLHHAARYGKVCSQWICTYLRILYLRTVRYIAKAELPIFSRIVQYSRRGHCRNLWPNLRDIHLLSPSHPMQNYHHLRTGQGWHWQQQDFDTSLQNIAICRHFFGVGVDFLIHYIYGRLIWH